MTPPHGNRGGGLSEAPDYDVVVVGAGLAGLHLLHQLRDELGLSVRIIEKADDVGGTWYWNRYPGARCDSESRFYARIFEDDRLREWKWSQRYAEQPEVLEYTRLAADHLHLRKDIDFETEVTAATFGEKTGLWEIETDDESRVTSQFFVTAVGSLSQPYIPDFEGINAFDGEWFHTARWPHDPVAFDGKRVGVIGTGATGAQVIPKIAQKAGHVTVFQRTPCWGIPARNQPITEDEWMEILADDIMQEALNSPNGFPLKPLRDTVEDLSVEEIEALLEPRWLAGGVQYVFAFSDLLTNPKTNEKMAECIRNKIREIVDDPAVAEKLLPDHPVGTKRPPLHTDYHETYNRDNVSLVDVSDAPIERITPGGIGTTDSEHELDVIIYATGFDAGTGAIVQMDIEGRENRLLDDVWADGPTTYLGFSTYGFPNMFMLLGPQSPSQVGNLPVSIHQQVEWLTNAIDFFRDENIQFVEPEQKAADAWEEHNRLAAEETLYVDASSYYNNENIPDSPNVFVPYVGGYDSYYDTICEVADKEYEGFQLVRSIDELGETGDEPRLKVLADDSISYSYS